MIKKGACSIQAYQSKSSVPGDPKRTGNQSTTPISLNKDQRSDGYNIYPVHPLVEGEIFNGYKSLCRWIVGDITILIDGYIGVFWTDIQDRLIKEINLLGYDVSIHFTDDYLKPTQQLNKLISPYLGSAGTVWGKKTDLQLHDFYEIESLQEIIDTNHNLRGWCWPCERKPSNDLPKNEIQSVVLVLYCLMIRKLSCLIHLFVEVILELLLIRGFTNAGCRIKVVRYC